MINLGVAGIFLNLSMDVVITRLLKVVHTDSRKKRTLEDYGVCDVPPTG